MNEPEAPCPSTPSCTIAGCTYPYRAKGFCGRHYARWRRTASDEEKRRPTPEDRFWAKVTVAGAGECWIWNAAVSPQGYGTFWEGATFTTAHRYSYTLAHGDPGSLVIDHVCHNVAGCTDAPCIHRRCVNPAHLEAVTQLVNSHRGRTGAHNAEKTHCSRGHEFSEDNTIAKYGGGRACRACSRVSHRRHNRKRKETS
jgi:hypothetical protein